MIHDIIESDGLKLDRVLPAQILSDFRVFLNDFTEGFEVKSVILIHQAYLVHKQVIAIL